MNAKEARELAGSINNTISQAEMKGVRSKIKEEAQKGGYSISIDKLSTPVKKKLEEEGFIVVHVHDPRDGGFTTISW